MKDYKSSELDLGEWKVDGRICEMMDEADGRLWDDGK
jgi:hypothetical protein